jgi:hypothetical protein
LSNDRYLIRRRGVRRQCLKSLRSPIPPAERHAVSSPSPMIFLLASSPLPVSARAVYFLRVVPFTRRLLHLSPAPTPRNHAARCMVRPLLPLRDCAPSTRAEPSTPHRPPLTPPCAQPPARPAMATVVPLPLDPIRARQLGFFSPPLPHRFPWVTKPTKRYVPALGGGLQMVAAVRALQMATF